MRKITTFIATCIIDDMTEDAASTYAEMISMGYPLRFQIGEDISWPIAICSVVIDTKELATEETSNG